jgi:hypothetical protein
MYSMSPHLPQFQPGEGPPHSSLSAPTFPSARKLNSDCGHSSPLFSLYRGRVPAFIAGRGEGMEPNHTAAKKHGLLHVQTCIAYSLFTEFFRVRKVQEC